MDDPQKRARCEVEYRRMLPLLGDYVDALAIEEPRRVAIVEHDTGEVVTYRRFSRASDAFAAKLASLGLGKGDVVATSLPFTKEHIFLEYACFKLGVLVAPLDLRSKAGEICDAFRQIEPKAYFFLGKTPRVDFRPIVREVMAAAPTVRTFVQFQRDAEGILPGAVSAQAFARDIERHYLVALLTGRLRRAKRRVGRRDPALIIFTTGSTGAPKPALLCHENILVQNIGLAVAFGITAADRMLVNLPPSHVGGQTEQLMTSFYSGGTAVVLSVFDAERSLEAIARHRVTICGQIPTLFAMQWRLPNYGDYDLSSLRFALYGGQSVDRAFLDRLGAMAPAMGTGLGLTETAGFCSYTPAAWNAVAGAGSLGFDSPLCPLTIRGPMSDDGAAGPEMPAGEVGEICCSGPQVFLGYLGDPAATRRTISKDGVCYTGDLGSYDARGLRFAGRAKLVLKPKGYQVFPAEIENFFVEGFPEALASAGCVGVPHAVFGEGIVAFLELKEGAHLAGDAIERRLRDIAAYKRPSHIVFLRPGEMPYNRVAKIDYLELRRRAEAEVSRLRSEGRWDAEPSRSRGA